MTTPEEGHLIELANQDADPRYNDPEWVQMQEDKKRQKVEDLKANWLGDPCWDLENTEGFEDYRAELENTEGFEDYRAELRTYRLACELEWKQKETDRQITKANTLGCSITMVHYLEILEHKIDRLDRENDKRKGG